MSAKPSLSAVVNVRLTEVEKAQLRHDAEVAGLTVSALVRRRALGRRVVASADLAVVRELRRQGGLVKHLHQQSGAHSVETGRALQAIERLIERISRGLS